MTASPTRKSGSPNEALGSVDAEIRAIYRKAMKGGTDDPLRTREMEKGPTEVRAAQVVAKDVELLLTIVPFLRGHVRVVTVGPTEGVMGFLNIISDDPTAAIRDTPDWPVAMLDGQWNYKKREVTIAPDYSHYYLDQLPQRRFVVLFHEFGHAAGLMHGREMDNLEGLALMRKEYMQRQGVKK